MRMLFILASCTYNIDCIISIYFQILSLIYFLNQRFLIYVFENKMLTKKRVYNKNTYLLLCAFDSAFCFLRKLFVCSSVTRINMTNLYRNILLLPYINVITTDVYFDMYMRIFTTLFFRYNVIVLRESSRIANVVYHNKYELWKVKTYCKII